MAHILKYILLEVSKMGDPTTKIENVSLAPLYGSGFITDGKFLKFGSPYPHGSTSLKGVESAADFKKVDEDNGQEKRIGELALMYFYGRTDDHFDQTDLPLGDSPLASLIQFSASRNARSHFVMSEWRWPLFSPAYQSEHFRFIQPQYSLGAGALWIRTQVIQDGPPEKVEDLAAFITGSTQLRFIEFSFGPLDLSLEASVRMMAGQAFGIIGEGALRFTYRR